MKRTPVKRKDHKVHAESCSPIYPGPDPIIVDRSLLSP